MKPIDSALSASDAPDGLKWASDSAVSRTDLASLCDLSSDLMGILDSQQRFVAVNSAFTAVLGWSRTDLLGNSFLDGVHPDERGAVLGALGRLASRAGPTHFSARVRQASGSYCPFQWTAGAQDGHWQLVGRRAPGSRVSDAAAHRIRVNDAAGNAKTEFLASMNHELRTPLNAILGYTELLSGDTSLQPRQREALHAIKRSSQHLLLLINDVLDFAKLDANKLTLSPQEFLLSGFLDNFVELFEPRARKKGISFVIQATTPLPVAVCADETRLRQVLLNLLSNAIKFTERGGVVLRAGYDGGILRFEVEDTGIGIPPESLEDVFHPFEQISDASRFIEGTGLGLSLCQHLVTLMGGTLQVTSEMGQGSKFWFEIEPSRVSRWPDKQVGHTVITGYEGPEISILVVDDQPQARAFLRQLLTTVGVRVVEAGDGLQAVTMAVAERPDLIIMDLVMPELDGFEASRRIRAREETRSIPIIAASVASPIVEMGVELARVADRPVYDGFLNKPIDLNALYDLVAEHLNLDWQFGSAHSGEWSIPELQPPAGQAGDVSGSRTGVVAGESGAGQASRDGHERAGDSAEPAAGDGQPGGGDASQEASARVTLGAQELQALYDAATIGDIREILSILERAGHRAGDDVEPNSLADRIHRLARAFRGRDIKELLQPYLP